jgi:hypothetical protein
MVRLVWGCYSNQGNGSTHPGSPRNQRRGRGIRGVLHPLQGQPEPVAWGARRTLAVPL